MLICYWSSINLALDLQINNLKYIILHKIEKQRGGKRERRRREEKYQGLHMNKKSNVSLSAVQILPSFFE